MKKIILFAALILSVMISGCMDIAMQYTPSAQLSDQYQDQVRDDYLTIFYSVKDAPNGKAVMMAVKNTGNIFVQNLSFNYNVSSDKVSTYTYKNIGNLKNRASKDLTILLPKNAPDSLKIDYMFTPVVEDAFLNKDMPQGFTHTEPIKGTLTIYLSK